MDAQAYATARAYFTERLVQLHGTGNRSAIANALDWFAILADAEGSSNAEASWWGPPRPSGRVAARPLSSGILPKTAHLASSGAPGEVRAFAQGPAMSPAEAVGYAAQCDSDDRTVRNGAQHCETSSPRRP